MELKEFKIKNTLGMFDLLKGVIMLSMMIGHTPGFTENYNSSYLLIFILTLMTFIEKISMPALFVISGYGYRRSSTVNNLKRLYKSIVIPFLITIFITAGLDAVFTRIITGYSKEAIKNAIMFLLSAILGVTESVEIGPFYLDSAGPCWFLLSYIVASIIFNELLKHFEGNKLLIASAILALLGWALSLIGFVPFTLCQGLISTMYFCLGYLAKKRKFFSTLQTSGKQLQFIAIAMFIYIPFMLLGGDFNLSYLSSSFGPIGYYVFALCSLAGILLFLHLNRFEGKLTSFIRYIGRNSIYVLCIHTIEIQGFGGSLQSMIMESWQGPVWLRNVCFIGTRFIVDLGVMFLFLWIKGHINKRRVNNNE